MPRKLSAQMSALKAKGLLNSKNELLLYGVIGDWWEGMDALSIVRELESISGDEVSIRIHSQGGRITEGLAMFNALNQIDKDVAVHIDGVCASMATVVAMAASPGKLYTPDNALWMVHKPWDEKAGNANDLRQAADNLDVIEQAVISAYTANGRVSDDRIREILSTGKDYLMTGAQAVSEGFADAIVGTVTAAASIDLTAMAAAHPNHQLINFYAVNAAQNHPDNQEDLSMTLAQLLAQKAALTNKGVAANTITTALAAAFGVDGDKLTELLKEGSDLSETQLKAGMDALNAIQLPTAPQAPAAPAATSVDAQAHARQAVADERQRVSGINALAARFDFPADQTNNLINQGSTLEEARAQVLDWMETRDRTHQPNPGFRIIDTGGEAFMQGMANAMMHRMAPGRYKLEDGGRDFRGMSLISMAAQCLERAGHSTRGMVPSEIAAKAMNTTSDFPNVVADVANKVLLSAYQAQPRTFLPISNQTTLSDFKSKHAIEIGGGSDLEEVKENGEIKIGSVSESKKSYKLSTFARIFNFSRQLLINDDISALNQFVANVGGLAARKESSVVWALVKAGSIFTSGNKNLVSSGGNVDETQLSNVRKLFRKQVGLDGEPINVSGKYLVVNSDRETEAQKFLAAILANATNDVNVFSGSMELIVEPLLDDVANNPWYSFADPMLVPALEHAYLEGESGPYIETKNGFEVDGIQIKVRHDFGAGWVSHRGAVKNPGA